LHYDYPSRPTAGGTDETTRCVNAGASRDNGVHVCGIVPQAWTPFYFRCAMKIEERLECASDNGVDPRRRRCVKAIAMALGGVILALAMLPAGSPAAPDAGNAVHPVGITAEASIK
jgi:hypothetical protein